MLQGHVDVKVQRKLYDVVFVKVLGRKHMNLLRRIKIENIKGKAALEVTFADLTANQPNIVVAPNGYGKSTIATAFKSASNGKMKINDKDMYQQNPDNHPKLELELYGEHSGTYISTDTEGNISKDIAIYTISSPLYAKSTTPRFNRNVASTADLRIEQVVVYNKIPENCGLDYSYRNFTGRYGSKRKLFVNIQSMLMDCGNIGNLIEIKNNLKKCCMQKGIQSKFAKFLDGCSQNGSSETIKKQISQDEINALYENENIRTLLECIIEMDDHPAGWCDVDAIFTAIQLCDLLKTNQQSGKSNILKKVYAFLLYKQTKSLIDERLDLFNTTGRNIQTHEDHGKLIISFERASSMSNGERDILSFISNLTKFEVEFKKQVGILIIDEIFDYLDGSNMLAVQYYLSQLIGKCKASGKVLFPIIFTHLDPEVFTNYYFKRKKVHYISSFSTIDINSPIVKLLRLRENNTLEGTEKEEIEKYYIHYNNEEHTPSNSLAALVSTDFHESNTNFRQRMYNEIKEEYLLDHEYNPIMVVVGIRIRIEELVYQKLCCEDKAEFIQQHKVINKLQFAEEQGVNVPELYFLLQPMYNDSLHLGGDDNAVTRKMKSCYLKTNNLHIRRMVQMLFE